MEIRKISLNEISKIINVGHTKKSTIINALNYADYHSSYNSVLTYCLNDIYIKKALENKSVKAIITSKDIYNNLKEIDKRQVSYFIVDQPKSTFYELHNYLCKSTIFYSDNEFPKQIGQDCIIDSSAVIENGVKIGNNVNICANTVIKRGTIIEDNVVIKDNSVIGVNNIELFEINKKRVLAIHTGGTKICKNAYVGSNSVIACNIFEGFCEIGSETYVDNMVHISHNNLIGKKTIITTGVVISGSVTVGDNCWIANGAVISNGITIGNNVKINTAAVVVENVEDDKTIAGFYAVDNQAWLLHNINLRKSFKNNKS